MNMSVFELCYYVINNSGYLFFSKTLRLCSAQSLMHSACNVIINDRNSWF